MTGTVQAGHLIAGKYNRLYFVQQGSRKVTQTEKVECTPPRTCGNFTCLENQGILLIIIETKILFRNHLSRRIKRGSVRQSIALFVESSKYNQTRLDV